MTQTQNWHVTKPHAIGEHGVVVTQCSTASEVGVGILEAGGNAVDAAVAAAFALAVVEPWNSGLGGIGFGLLRLPDGNVMSLDFGPVAPSQVKSNQFPISGAVSKDIFGWPKVMGNTNVHGPLSFCIPGAVAGYGKLHARYGKMRWADVLEPAVRLSQRGMQKDWFSTVKIAQMAHYLRLYEESARIYLPNGLPPTGNEKGNPEFMDQGSLKNTLEHLQYAGSDDFYRGELAETLVKELAEQGSVISKEDLASYQAHLTPADVFDWGNGNIFLPHGSSAGPMLRQVMEAMPIANDNPAPNLDWLSGLTSALLAAVQDRIEGEDSETVPQRESCTTHLNVVDSSGMGVSLTGSLLGLMGSAVVLPRTGILMNNGMMWFDPRPRRKNSIGATQRPQSNMLPVVYQNNDSFIVAGASGGRRILSSVVQSLAYMVQFGMSPQDAAHTPRIDVSGVGEISIDNRMEANVADTLGELGRVQICEHAAAPLNFGCPSFIKHNTTGSIGIPDVMTPWSAALAATVNNQFSKPVVS